MPRFDVQIAEPPPVVEPREEPGGLGSFVRGVALSCKAADDNAAIAAAWVAWDEKHGPRRQPADAIVNVTELNVNG